MSFIFFLFLVGNGFFVGYQTQKYGKSHGWSDLKSMVVSGIIGFFTGIFISFIFLLLSVFDAKADSQVALDNLKENTVHISNGTGFIYTGSKGKYLVTNWHVCNSANWYGTMQASFQEGDSVKGVIVKQNPLYDLCFSKVETKVKGLRLAPSISKGEHLYSRGYPQHVLSNSEGRVVGYEAYEYQYPIEEVGTCFKGSRPVRNEYGNVAACEMVFKYCLTTLYARPGSSGSPVVNRAGELVGVISSYLRGDGNENLAGIVRFDYLKEMVNDL